MFRVCVPRAWCFVVNICFGATCSRTLLSVVFADMPYLDLCYTPCDRPAIIRPSPRRGFPRLRRGPSLDVVTLADLRSRL